MSSGALFLAVFLACAVEGVEALAIVLAAGISRGWHSAISGVVAGVVVAIELAVISWIRHHFMDTPLLAAIFQVVLGGVLVFITGIVIGSA